MQVIEINIKAFTKADGTQVKEHVRKVTVDDFTDAQLAKLNELKGRIGNGDNKAISELDDVDQVVPRNIRDIENQIVKNKFETAIIYDENGKIIFNKKGKKNSVSITFNEMLTIGGLKGKNLTHNHTVETSFSSADVEMFLNNRLLKIRAISKNHQHELVSKGKDMNQKQVNDVIKSYKRYTRLTRIKLTNLLHNGELTEKEFRDNFYHNVMTDLAKDYEDFFKYSRK